MPDGVIPPLEEFIGSGGGPPTYAGPPNVGDLPSRDRRTPGTVVGRRHTAAPTVLNIVDSEGRGFPVDLAQLTQAGVARAVVPPDAVGNAQDAAVATFHKLATGQRQTPQPRSPAYTGVVVTPLGQPQASGPLPRRRAMPMGQPEPVPASPPVAEPPVSGYVEQGVRQTRPNLVAPPMLTGQVAPPGQQVTYEIPGYGPLEAFYHQVIRTGDHLVIVFDKRWVGQRGFPRHSPSQLGMRVHGTDKLFVVQTTGIEFELDGKALCLLQIVSEGSYSAYVEQNDPLAQSMNLVPFPPENANGEVRRYPTGSDPVGDATAHDDVPGF